ncbi:hypothetical protein T484DRAFT_1922152, partial [Baffinella frigidus]
MPDWIFLNKNAVKWLPPVPGLDPYASDSNVVHAVMETWQHLFQFVLSRAEDPSLITCSRNHACLSLKGLSSHENDQLGFTPPAGTTPLSFLKGCKVVFTGNDAAQTRAALRLVQALDMTMAAGLSSWQPSPSVTDSISELEQTLEELEDDEDEKRAEITLGLDFMRSFERLYTFTAAFHAARDNEDSIDAVTTEIRKFATDTSINPSEWVNNLDRTITLHQEFDVYGRVLDFRTIARDILASIVERGLENWETVHSKMSELSAMRTKVKNWSAIRQVLRPWARAVQNHVARQGSQATAAAGNPAALGKRAREGDVISMSQADLVHLLTVAANTSNIDVSDTTVQPFLRAAKKTCEYCGKSGHEVNSCFQHKRDNNIAFTKEEQEIIDRTSRGSGWRSRTSARETAHEGATVTFRGDTQHQGGGAGGSASQGPKVEPSKAKSTEAGQRMLAAVLKKPFTATRASPPKKQFMNNAAMVLALNQVLCNADGAASPIVSWSSIEEGYDWGTASPFTYISATALILSTILVCVTIADRVTDSSRLGFVKAPHLIAAAGLSLMIGAWQCITMVSSLSGGGFVLDAPR